MSTWGCFPETRATFLGIPMARIMGLGFRAWGLGSIMDPLYFRKVQCFGFFVQVAIGFRAISGIED